VITLEHVAGQQGVQIIAMDKGWTIGLRHLVERKINKHDRADPEDIAAVLLRVERRFGEALPPLTFNRVPQPTRRSMRADVPAITRNTRVATLDNFERRLANRMKFCHVLGLIARRHRNTADLKSVDDLLLGFVGREHLEHHYSMSGTDQTASDAQNPRIALCRIEVEHRDGLRPHPFSLPLAASGQSYCTLVDWSLRAIRAR